MACFKELILTEFPSYGQRNELAMCGPGLPLFTLVFPVESFPGRRKDLKGSCLPILMEGNELKEAHII